MVRVPNGTRVHVYVRTYVHEYVHVYVLQTIPWYAIVWHVYVRTYVVRTYVHVYVLEYRAADIAVDLEPQL
jgi:hypothetical protein